MPYDKGGEIALKGKVDEDWLQSLMDEPYYSMHCLLYTSEQGFFYAVK